MKIRKAKKVFKRYIPKQCYVTIRTFHCCKHRKNKLGVLFCPNHKRTYLLKRMKNLKNGKYGYF